MSSKVFKRLLTTSLVLAMALALATPISVQAKKKKKTIPTCTMNVFIGDSWVAADRTTKVVKVSKKKLVKQGKDDDGKLMLTATKAGTVTVTLKNKKKQTNLKFVINGNKEDALKLKLGKEIFGFQNTGLAAGTLYEAEITNTTKVPITRANIHFKDAHLLELNGDSDLYCLIPGKKIKTYIVVESRPENVKIEQVTLTYYRCASYTDMTNKIKMSKKVESSVDEQYFTFAWDDKFSTSGTQKADYAMDITGFSEGGVPKNAHYIGGDMNAINKISYTYTSSAGAQGIDASAVSRAVLYKFGTEKWV